MASSSDSGPGRRRKVEVLAPAGGHPQLQAAIENGADAVYFGLQRWNARARAANFRPEELEEILAMLHERGVQGFVTLNTVLFDEELRDALAMAEQVARAGADALIVQDLGFAARVHRELPGLRLHGSTQMTVTSCEGVELAAAVGASRVVLARELSVREIAQVAARSPVEVEAFVHGALCVSYSGQCFSSESWGGRSANRGQCAQACRLPYDMLVDGAHRPLGDARYLLSPQDLMGVDHVPALVAAGVSCLKIEGRLKGPEYVALTTATYRQAVDAAANGVPFALDAGQKDDLAQVFSRGLTPGFLDGPRHQRLVEGRSPRHRGPLVGRVTALGDRWVALDARLAVEIGDGAVFDGGRPDLEESGGTVEGVEVTKGRGGSLLLRLRFGPRCDGGGGGVGDRVWRTRSPGLETRLRASYQQVRRRVPVDARLTGEPGLPLRLEFRDDDGHSAVADSSLALVAAERRALDGETLAASIGRLGATVLQLRHLEVEIRGPVFLPLQALNELRRRVASTLLAARRQPHRADPPVLRPLPAAQRREAPLLQPELSVLCRTPEQVAAACALPWLREVVVDFLEVKGLGESVRAVQAAGKRAVAASPRVLKPDEERIRAFLLRLGADAILVRSLGLLRSLCDEPTAPALHGDHSLNATNAETVRWLFERGIQRLAPGHDLNASQLAALAAGGAHGLELIVHHHLPIFHTEHCVFARFLSSGNGPADCGHPCERHAVHLRGGDGKAHLVQADIGCRNTVLNAEAQSAVRSLPALQAAGWRRFRVELSDHRPDEVAPLLDAYRAVMQRFPGPAEAWRRVRSASRHALTLGSLRVLDEPDPEQRKAPGWTMRSGGT